MKRHIVITGASRGIGRAAAELLHQSGWAVIGVARKAPETFPGEFISMDLSAMRATQALASTLAARGDVLGVVNNVGLVKSDTIGTVDLADFSSIVDLNVRPALQLTQELVASMRKARFGRIINITSLVTRGLPFRTSYAAAKSALESVTRSMAIELAPDGITANAVAPGPTETEFFRSHNAVGSASETRFLEQVPMGRIGRPEEIAAAIAFLASESASLLPGRPCMSTAVRP